MFTTGVDGYSDPAAYRKANYLLLPLSRPAAGRLLYFRE